MFRPFWIEPKKPCDVCNRQQLQEYYDARIRIGQRVCWANCCEGCWHQYGMGTLGTGLGQFYVYTGKGYELVRGGTNRKSTIEESSK